MRSIRTASGSMAFLLVAVLSSALEGWISKAEPTAELHTLSGVKTVNYEIKHLTYNVKLMVCMKRWKLAREIRCEV